MYRLFSRNDLMSYILLVVLMVLLRLRLLLSPETYVLADTPDLFSPFWTDLFGHVAAGTTLSGILAIIVMTLTALIVANLVNRFRLAPQPSALGGLFFVILCGGPRLTIGFQPIMFFTLSLVWALDRFFSAQGKDRPYLSVAWGVAIATFGAMLWTKGLWLLLFLPMALALLRLARPRILLSGLVGFITVVIIMTSVALFHSNPLEVADAFVSSLWATMPYWRLGPVSLTYFLVTLGICLMAVMNVQRHLVETNINVSRRLRVAEWLLFITIFLQLLPTYSLEVQMLTAVGASLLLSRFVAGLSTRGAEIVTITLAALAFWIIYM